METTEKIQQPFMRLAPTSLPYCMKGYNPEVN